MEKVLIVEDDKLLNDGIAFALEGDGYEIFQATDCEKAKELLELNLDLVILDINLPDSDGYTLCKYIRAHISAAVIFLTAKDTEADMIEGFKMGGDDYITKPFSLPVFKERIKAVLRRAKNNSRLYVCRNITFDLDKLLLTKDREELSLTPTELKLMQLFIENKSKVLTRGQILERIWDIDGDFVDENALNVNIRRLRGKIEDNPSKPGFIKTVFGIGYMWGDNI